MAPTQRNRYDRLHGRRRLLLHGVAAKPPARSRDSTIVDAGYRIRGTQFTILSQLMLRGEMPLGRLAGLLGMERTTLTRNLAPLEAAEMDHERAPATIRARA